MKMNGRQRAGARTRLLTYLKIATESRHEPEDWLGMLLGPAQERLLEYAHQHRPDMEASCLVEVTDASLVEAAARDSEGQVRRALKTYAGFLRQRKIRPVLSAAERAAAQTHKQKSETRTARGSEPQAGQGGPTAPQELFTEGRILEIKAREGAGRSAAARRACIERWGCRCWVCGFDFEAAYGALGHGFIEVHHRRLHSSFSGEHTVDSADDLVPLCSNCHSMVHRAPGDQPLSPEKLKEIITVNSKPPTTNG